MSGSLQKHGDRWRGFLYVATENGREKRRTKVFDHDHSRAGKRAAEAEMRAWVDAELAKHQRGPTGTRRTVSDLLTAWRISRAATWSLKHQADTRQWCENKIGPRIGHVELGDLEPSTLDRMYADLAAAGGRLVEGVPQPLAPSSVKRAHTIMRTALGVALGWGWVDTNVAERATPPKVRRTEIHPPTVDQVKAAAEAAAGDGDPWTTYLRLAVTTGARRSELLGLRWSDIDLTNATLTINRGVTAADGQLEVKPPKSGEPRTISLDVTTLEMLAGLRDRQTTIAAVGGWLQSDAYVFAIDEHDRPVHPDSVRNWWRRVTKRTPTLREVRLHDLRHFAATQMLQAGVPLTIVAYRLGHRDTATTLRIYAHFMPASDRGAADIMSGIVGETDPITSLGTVRSN